MSIELTPLEREVMEMLLRGDDAVLRVLRDQLKASRVTGREFTGTGFYTTFAVPDCVARVQGNKSFNFGDVTAEIDGLQSGAGFVLFVKNGVIDFLEGYSYDEQWPLRVERFTLAYIGGTERDLESLRKKWT
jgi:hypothetical protein